MREEWGGEGSTWRARARFSYWILRTRRGIHIYGRGWRAHVGTGENRVCGHGFLDGHGRRRAHRRGEIRVTWETLAVGGSEGWIGGRLSHRRSDWIWGLLGSGGNRVLHGRKLPR
jgi:hypothetical protein